MVTRSFDPPPTSASMQRQAWSNHPQLTINNWLITNRKLLMNSLSNNFSTYSRNLLV